MEAWTDPAGNACQIDPSKIGTDVLKAKGWTQGVKSKPKTVKAADE